MANNGNNGFPSHEFKMDLKTILKWFYKMLLKVNGFEIDLDGFEKLVTRFKEKVETDQKLCCN